VPPRRAACRFVNVRGDSWAAAVSAHWSARRGARWHRLYHVPEARRSPATRGPSTGKGAPAEGRRADLVGHLSRRAVDAL